MESSPNRSCRRRPRFWARPGNSPSPDAKAALNQIELKAKAYEYRELNLRALRGRHRLAEVISRCTVSDPCAKILCPCCARRYRRWLAPEILVHVSQGIATCAMTILLCNVRGRDLQRVDLKAEQETLRKRLVRAGFRAVVGGTEASYNAEDDLWTIHVHLTVFGEVGEALKRLRLMFGRNSPDRPILRERIDDVVGWVTYLQKFVTYHRPGSARTRWESARLPNEASADSPVGEMDRTLPVRTFSLPPRLSQARTSDRTRARHPRTSAEATRNRQATSSRRRWRRWRRSKTRPTVSIDGLTIANDQCYPLLQQCYPLLQHF